MEKLTIRGYLDSLASSEPAPGGGAAAALTAAQGIALCAMVLRISGGDRDLICRADELIEEFKDLATEDAQAFNAVIAAQKLPKATEDEQKTRLRALDLALKNAAKVPLTVMELILSAKDLVSMTHKIGKASVISDVGVGVELLAGAMLASKFNVLANVKYIKDQEYNSGIRQKILGLERDFMEYLSPLRLDLATKF